MSNFNIEFYIEFKNIEYIVYLSVTETGLIISIENNMPTYWLANCGVERIDEITQKAGSYKNFNVFVKMLMSALSQDNDSVTFELLYNKDLELMKQSKKSYSMNDSMSQDPERANRLYLVVIYSGDFEKVSYPIPLYYQNPVPSELFLRTINRLTSVINFKEIEEIKQENVNLRNKVLLLESQRKQGAVDNEENYRTLHNIADEYQNYKIKAEQDISYLMRTIEEMQNNLSNSKNDKTENIEKYKKIIVEKELRIKELEENLVKERKMGKGFVDEKTKGLEKVMKDLHFSIENEKRLKVRINQLEKEIEYQTKRNYYESNRSQKVKNMSSNRSYSKDSSVGSQVSNNSKSSLRKNLLANPYSKVKDINPKNYVSFFKTSNASSIKSNSSKKSNTSKTIPSVSKYKATTTKKSSTSSVYSKNSNSKVSSKITPKITTIPKKTVTKPTQVNRITSMALNNDLQTRLQRIDHLIKTAKS
jgi:hypothetical protein